MDDMPELYLTTQDVKRWLELTQGQLASLNTSLGLDPCGGGRAEVCRYHKAHLKELKACAGIMHETGVSPTAAVKVHRALQARAAAKTAQAPS